MKNLFYVVMCAILFTSVSCKMGGSGSTKTSKNGYKYILYNTGAGDVISAGDVVYFDIVVKHQDSILQDSKTGPMQPELLMPDDSLLKAPNPVIEAFNMMKQGDSIKIYERIDTVKNLPEQMKNWKEITYNIHVTKVIKGSELNATKEREPGIAKLIEEKITAYKGNALTDIKTTPSGLKYIILEEGTGKEMKEGDEASIQYYGIDLKTNKNFDSSFKRGLPFKFQVGAKQVIPGWEEAATLIKGGTKAVFFIPSSLAYGKNGIPGTIEPDADLAFYMEAL